MERRSLIQAGWQGKVIWNQAAGYTGDCSRVAAQKFPELVVDQTQSNTTLASRGSQDGSTESSLLGHVDQLSRTGKVD
jgi:hypothetical protein